MNHGSQIDAEVYILPALLPFLFSPISFHFSYYIDRHLEEKMYNYDDDTQTVRTSIVRKAYMGDRTRRQGLVFGLAQFILNTLFSLIIALVVSRGGSI